MSKSVGNVVAPQEIVKAHGADILRLWVAAEDYRDDVRISREILDARGRGVPTHSQHRAVPARQPRRTSIRRATGCRRPQLLELDRFILDRLQDLVDRCRRAYDAFEFHAVYHALNNFCSVDLSALYLDIVKDRLYCDGATSPERRSAQTALHAISRRAGAADGADPLVHRRGDLELHAGGRRASRRACCSRTFPPPTRRCAIRRSPPTGIACSRYAAPSPRPSRSSAGRARSAIRSRPT